MTRWLAKAHPWLSKLPWMVIVLLIFVLLCEGFEDLGNVDCNTTLDSIMQKQRTKSEEVDLICPSTCLVSACRVTGSNPYTDSSSVCCAAIHSGAISSVDGGIVTVQIGKEMNNRIFHGSSCNGIKSRMRLRSAFVWFRIENASICVTSTASTTTRTTTSFEGLVTGKVADFSVKTEQSAHTIGIGVRPQPSTENSNVIANQNSFSQVESPITTRTKFYPNERNQTNMTISPNNIQTSNLNVVQINNRQHTFSSSSLAEIIGLIIGVFFAGSLFALLIVCFVKKKRMDCKSWYRRYKRSNDQEQSDCVCYTNINSSRQGLLTDPETCERPCSIRQPRHEDENDLINNFPSLNCRKLEHSDTHRGPSSTKHTDIAYESECSSHCSGACNPQQFDF